MSLGLSVLLPWGVELWRMKDGVTRSWCHFIILGLWFLWTLILFQCPVLSVAGHWPQEAAYPREA